MYNCFFIYLLQFCFFLSSCLCLTAYHDTLSRLFCYVEDVNDSNTNSESIVGWQTFSSLCCSVLCAAFFIIAETNGSNTSKTNCSSSFASLSPSPSSQGLSNHSSASPVSGGLAETTSGQNLRLSSQSSGIQKRTSEDRIYSVKVCACVHLNVIKLVEDVTGSSIISF